MSVGPRVFLVQLHRLNPGRYGRLLQRLVEIETYRLAAMLSLPLARDLLPQVETLEAQHVALVERIGVMDAGEERALLGDLTNLSLATERLQARCGSRFSRTESYARILSRGCGNCARNRCPVTRRSVSFSTGAWPRPCTPAHGRMRGCGALSARVQSTTGLLRTGVEVNLQSQNQLLLASVDRRAAAQLRLQHNVEGLSVVVLTYYLANLLKLALEGSEEGGYCGEAAADRGAGAAAAAGAVWWAVRRAGTRVTDCGGGVVCLSQPVRRAYAGKRS